MTFVRLPVPRDPSPLWLSVIRIRVEGAGLQYWEPHCQSNVWWWAWGARSMQVTYNASAPAGPERVNCWLYDEGQAVEEVYLSKKDAVVSAWRWLVKGRPL